MIEASGSSTGKRRIESLSDLIFGLALSIGALTLIGQPPNSFAGLISSILYYGFSFLILIMVWSSYTQAMSQVSIETRRIFGFNVMLLFFVSIEPYLFNLLMHPSQGILVQDVSVIYALDLGGLFIVQSLLLSPIIADKSQPQQLIRHYKLLRNAQIISAIFFFVSALPFFWAWAIIIDDIQPIQLRFIFWLAPFFIRAFRRLAIEKS